MSADPVTLAANPARRFDQPTPALADYVVPVSIDHAGRHPGKRPGDTWFEEVNGRRFRMELTGKPYGRRPGYDPAGGATVLCDCHVREVRA